MLYTDLTAALCDGPRLYEIEQYVKIATSAAVGVLSLDVAACSIFLPKYIFRFYFICDVIGTLTMIHWVLPYCILSVDTSHHVHTGDAYPGLHLASSGVIHVFLGQLRLVRLFRVTVRGFPGIHAYVLAGLRGWRHDGDAITTSAEKYRVEDEVARMVGTSPLMESLGGDARAGNGVRSRRPGGREPEERIEEEGINDVVWQFTTDLSKNLLVYTYTMLAMMPFVVWVVEDDQLLLNLALIRYGDEASYPLMVEEIDLSYSIHFLEINGASYIDQPGESLTAHDSLDLYIDSDNEEFLLHAEINLSGLRRNTAILAIAINLTGFLLFIGAVCSFYGVFDFKKMQELVRRMTSTLLIAKEDMPHALIEQYGQNLANDCLKKVAGVGSSSSVALRRRAKELGITDNGELTLDMLLNDPLGAECFKVFMLSEMSIENLFFWLAVEKYRSNVVQSALELYTTYIAPGKLQVNLEGKQVRLIERGLPNPTATMFDDAQKCVFQLMRTDPFPRFLASDMYVRYRLGQMEAAKQVATTTASPASAALQSKRIMSRFAESLRSGASTPGTSFFGGASSGVTSPISLDDDVMSTRSRYSAVSVPAASPVGSPRVGRNPTIKVTDDTGSARSITWRFKANEKAVGDKSNTSPLQSQAREANQLRAPNPSHIQLPYTSHSAGTVSPVATELSVSPARSRKFSPRRPANRSSPSTEMLHDLPTCSPSLNTSPNGEDRAFTSPGRAVRKGSLESLPSSWSHDYDDDRNNDNDNEDVFDSPIRTTQKRRGQSLSSLQHARRTLNLTEKRKSPPLLSVTPPAKNTNTDPSSSAHVPPSWVGRLLGVNDPNSPTNIPAFMGEDAGDLISAASDAAGSVTAGVASIVPENRVLPPTAEVTEVPRERSLSQPDEPPLLSGFQGLSPSTVSRAAPAPAPVPDAPGEAVPAGSDAALHSVVVSGSDPDTGGRAKGQGPRAGRADHGIELVLATPPSSVDGASCRHEESPRMDSSARSSRLRMDSSNSVSTNGGSAVVCDPSGTAKPSAGLSVVVNSARSNSSSARGHTARSLPASHSQSKQSTPRTPLGPAPPEEKTLSGRRNAGLDKDSTDDGTRGPAQAWGDSVSPASTGHLSCDKVAVSEEPRKKTEKLVKRTPSKALATGKKKGKLQTFSGTALLTPTKPASQGVLEAPGGSGSGSGRRRSYSGTFDGLRRKGSRVQVFQPAAEEDAGGHCSAPHAVHPPTPSTSTASSASSLLTHAEAEVETRPVLATPPPPPGSLM
eukprot:Rmarinus@m.9474